MFRSFLVVISSLIFSTLSFADNNYPWTVNAGIAHVNPDVSSGAVTGIPGSRVGVDIDPFVFMVGIGYHF